MKTFRLLTAALLLAASASAQSYMGPDRKGEYAPTVYLISVHEVDTICTDPCNARQVMARNRAAMANATQDYLETHRTGFQQTALPQFVFASKNNRFSFSVGGYVSLRTAYGFEGITDNIDFVPYDIPVPGNYNTRQKLTMDASATRLYGKFIGNTRALGRVVVYIDGDLHGGAQGSYRPHLRSAYVSFAGFTFGRDVTTFCDLMAAPNTVDYQGPNAYNHRYATMVRYEIPFADDCLKFGIAAEMPDVTATYNENFAPLNQRMPDFPAYLQLAWGPGRKSHIRASAVVRNLYAYNTVRQSNTSLLGWGVQFSGHINITRWIQFFMNGTYGKGIAPYIQDLEGSGLDFTPNPSNPSQIQTMPMWGWQAAAQFGITSRFSVSGGYSMVRVDEKNGSFADQYRQGEYIFGNVFFGLSPRCRLAFEYLYGTRKNIDGQNNHANRAQMLVQYYF